MAGTSVQITVDDAEVKAALDALAQRAQDLRPAFEEIGSALLLSTQRRFERETGPDGQRWKVLAPATILARLGGSKAFTKAGRIRKPALRRAAALTILRDTGRLYRSLTYRARARDLQVGTNVIYARIHQFGGKAGRGRKVTIPARPYLGVDDSDRAEIVTVLREHLMGGAGAV